ncbi:hypothetical protein [aff. Roholtiella sp. LEGE 12411]|uniref:hypothetical protein n=1 Tax=aff. Roholtiella sp. LEGE 12411 TaxID=1828822 RepID=UPI00187FF302|nr:hypothetical protein [aff. Roholtiella sp. LEGE 12411]MBE9037664.1 hypothetical protein [aff. Roholtiella sp. LEGE 12411]
MKIHELEEEIGQEWLVDILDALNLQAKEEYDIESPELVQIRQVAGVMKDFNVSAHDAIARLNQPAPKARKQKGEVVPVDKQALELKTKLDGAAKQAALARTKANLETGAKQRKKDHQQEQIGYIHALVQEVQGSTAAHQQVLNYLQNSDWLLGIV